jgi:acetyl esterase/lipase
MSPTSIPVRSSVWSLLLIVIGSISSIDAADPVRTTHAYKQVGDLEIKADVYGAAPGESRPVLVWIHGGGLIGGNREGVDKRLRDAMLAAGCVVVSIDYRLAPETKLPEIIADIEDAFRWVRSEGPKLFGADPARIGVAGGSAGGYLTLVSGYRVDPPPQALVSLYGYGDIIAPWYSEPSPHPRHHRKHVSREEAWKQVSGPAVADSRDRKGDGGVFYEHCRQHGLWPLAVSGWDPKAEADKFTPYMPAKNVTAKYPPTVLIHGTVDTDVPYEQSVEMADEFQRAGVDHRLISLEGGEHGFGGADPKAVDDAYSAAIAFLKSKLKAE